MKLDSYVSGFLMVTATAAVAVLGLVVVRRILHARDLISSHDVGGYLLSVVGTMYAVILGLIVVDAMGKFHEARLKTEQEANSLADIILLGDQMPSGERDQVRKLALDYVDLVVRVEWPTMDHGRHTPEARRAAIDLVDAVCRFQPSSEKERTIYEAQLAAACEFWNCRRSRIVTASHGVAALEWVVLILGGVITVAFTYFFKLEHLNIQVVMTAMVSTIIALNLFLVLMFGYPYSGDLKIPSDIFNAVVSVIEHQDRRPSQGLRDFAPRPPQRDEARADDSDRPFESPDQPAFTGTKGGRASRRPR